MPITRFQVRIEYGSGAKELYGDSVQREDPKGIVDGVAVASLVGVLRQLGDLADFAAEVFHDLQEQVMTTSSRTRKLMTRVEHVEAALPTLEKAILTQKSHINFAYSPGTEWHARIRSEQNHFIYNDLPFCILDSYEECKEPPRLQFLDRFDTGGPGSCLKRYSDPNFFRRASRNYTQSDENFHKGMESCKTKNRRSVKRRGQFSHVPLSFDANGRVRFSSPSHPQLSPTQTVSTFDMTFKSETVDQSDSVGSGDGLGFVDCVINSAASAKPNESYTVQSLSNETITNISEWNHPEKHSAVGKVNKTGSSNSDCSPSSVTWDEKLGMSEPMALKTSKVEFLEPKINPTFRTSMTIEVEKLHEEIFAHDEHHIEHIDWNSGSDEIPKMPDTNVGDDNAFSDPTGQHFLVNEVLEVHETNFECGNTELMTISPMSEIDAAINLHERNTLLSKQTEPSLGGSANEMGPTFEREDTARAYLDECEHDENESETDNFVDALNTIESESETELDCETKRKVQSCLNPEIVSEESKLPYFSTNDLNQALLRAPLDQMSSSLPVHESSLMVALTSTLSLAHLASFKEAPSASNGSGSDECLNHNDTSALVHLADNMASQDLDPSSVQEESLKEALSEINISGGKGCPYHNALLSSVPSDDTGIQSSPVQIRSPGNICCTNGNCTDDSRTKSSSGKPLLESRETSEMNSVDGVVHPRSVAHQSSFDSSVAQSTLWANESFLGLQPSQPTDFGTSDPIISNDISLRTDNHEIPFARGQPSQCSNSDLNVEPVKSITSLKINSFDDSQAQTQSTASVMPPQTEDHVASEAKLAPNQAIHIEERRFLFSRPGHGFLMNSLGRDRSMGYDEKAKAAGFQKIHNLNSGQGGPLDDSLFGEKAKELSVTSASPSPPLEHMKISFQPINSSETSKLKLKYPEEIDLHKESLDAFPSFQLVPEPTDFHLGVGLDSDDDTFCRSNPYLSDDDASHLSDSYSGLWDSRDTSESEGHIMPNALCRTRISYEESVSSSSEKEEAVRRILEDESKPIQEAYKMGETLTSSTNLPDMPVLYNTNPLYRKLKISSDPKDSMESFCLREITPEPPPLPPLQWRISRSQSDVGKAGGAPKILSLLPNSTNHGSEFSHQQTSAPEMFINKAESLSTTRIDKPVEGQKLKFNYQEKSNQAALLGRVDEREDFLLQIQTKAFNLRKTATSRPAYTPAAAPTHVKVTAILEKAKTIRQAVASDDGEDGWSDT